MGAVLDREYSPDSGAARRLEDRDNGELLSCRQRPVSAPAAFARKARAHGVAQAAEP